MNRTIDYRDGDTPLAGYFAPAAGGGRAPGVLIVHAWLGITDSIKGRADRIAAAGYSAFRGRRVRQTRGHRRRAAAGGRPRSAPTAGCSGSASGPGWTPCGSSRSATRDRLAAIGYCFGGNAVLELARDGAPLRGVVSFHGELDTPLPAKPGDIAGKLLVLTGDDDPVVPFDKVAAFRDEMRAARANWQIDIYSGAKHSFTGEGSLGAERTPEAVLHPQAEARSWRSMMNFFAEVFGT